MLGDCCHMAGISQSETIYTSSSPHLVPRLLGACYRYHHIAFYDKLKNRRCHIHHFALTQFIGWYNSQTKLMAYSFKEKANSDIKFNNVTLESVETHKYLGLHLSRYLSSGEDIKGIIKSVSSMSDVLKRLKYDLDRTCIETNYFRFIRPRFIYAAQVRDNCNHRECDLLESVIFCMNSNWLRTIQVITYSTKEQTGKHLLNIGNQLNSNIVSQLSIHRHLYIFSHIPPTSDQIQHT